MQMKEFSGTKDLTERSYEIAHKQIAREAAAEGFVLLKNEAHVLPFSENCEIALFGAGAVKTVKGGTGSGNVYSRHTVSVWEGMEKAGFQITNRNWLESYERLYEDARMKWKEIVWARADELSKKPRGIGPLFEAYMITPFDIPAGELSGIGAGDKAVFVLARNAGEGADRRLEKGDYYLLDQEHELLKAVCSSYKKVVLIINAGGAVDLEFTEEFPNIKSILYISQPGQEAGHAVSDVLLGKVSPSGKLTATWPLRYEDIPFAEEYSYLNGDTDHDYYRQGIFVGYRYFDTFEKPVRYGFGHGLSYTNFSIKIKDIIQNNDTLSLTALVQNTGPVAGKEVLQVYASCPQGRLQKEYRRLTGFAKTKLLQPSETEEIIVSFPIRALASFDEKMCAWILEKGRYGIFAGGSLETATYSAFADLQEDVVLELLRHICPLGEELEELTPDADCIRKKRSVLEEEPSKGPGLLLAVDGFAAKQVVYGRYDGADEDENLAIVKKLSREQKIKLCTGDFTDKNDQGAIGAAGWTIPGTAAQTSSCAVEEGVPSVALADGPAGIRLVMEYQVIDGKPIVPTLEESIEGGLLLREEKKKGDETWYQFCTAFPVGTLIAQTWNRSIMKQFGRAIGEEVDEFNIRFWLAPGMNIQRNPLCGRNFEYYSEDPLLAGITAASVTEGVQSRPGRGVTIKHFACNSQENNRMHVDAVISERTLREIYLKGFEIAVKTSQPMAIMTSYNLINGIHAANNYDLCTKLARDEWDFGGIIMTDWTTTNQGPDCTAAGCLRAGNDLIMPGRQSDHDNINMELDAGTLSPEELDRSTARIVKVLR